MCKEKYFFFSVFLLVLTSCCSYLPFIDMQLISDFEKRKYKIEENQYLVNEDSLIIKMDANAFIPKNCKSKKLKLFLANVKLDIKKNLYEDSLIIELRNNDQVTSSDNKNIIPGNINIENSQEICYLIIKGKNYYLMQNGFKSDSLYYKFDYSTINDFDYNNQSLRINFGTIKLIKGIIKTEEVAGKLL